MEITESSQMEITEPSKIGFTVYYKSGCKYCLNVKQLLEYHKFQYIKINCDDYLINDKDFFLSFIKSKSQMEHKTFPIIFNNEIFIGGYKETKEYIDKLISFDENNFEEI